MADATGDPFADLVAPVGAPDDPAPARSPGGPAGSGTRLGRAPTGARPGTDAVPRPLPAGVSGDLPAPREAVPRPGAGATAAPFPADLMASRDAVPRPGPGTTGSPFPADLVASRDAVPRPGGPGAPFPADLVASRDAVPRPGATGVPLPADLMASREAVPRPGGPGVPLPAGGGTAPDVPPMLDEDLFGSRPPSRAARAGGVGAGVPADRPPAELQPGLDLFLGDLPAASGSPLAPLDLGGPPGLVPDVPFGSGLGLSGAPEANAFDHGASPSAPDPYGLGLDLPDAPGATAPLGFGLDPAAPALADPLGLGLDVGAAAPAAPGGGFDPGVDAGLDIGSMLESMLPGGPPSSAASARPATRAFAAPAPLAAPLAGRAPARASFLGGAPSSGGTLGGAPAPSPLLPDGLLPDPLLPNTPMAEAPAPDPASFAPPPDPSAYLPVDAPESPASDESGFQLRFDSSEAPAADSPARPAVVLPNRAVEANPGNALPVGVARLAPPRRRPEGSAALPARAVPRKKVLLAALGGGVLLIGAAAAVVITSLGPSDDPGAVLGALTSDVARDHFPSYAVAAQTLLAAAGDAKAPALRGAAAELTLLAVLGRGVARSTEKAKSSEVEALLADAPTGAAAPPQVARARALLAVARGRGSDVDTQLGAEADTPAGRLVVGLRRLRERKYDAAVTALRAAAAAEGNKVLATYLLGRALEEAGDRTQARAAYAQVTAANPQHAGALVGLLRVEATRPVERRRAAEALLTKLAGAASPADLAEAQVLVGEANVALGRTTEAVEGLTRAVSALPQNPAGQRALVEALLADGRPADALARLRSADPALLTSLDGRIAMGAALVANGQVAEGTGQLEAAAAEANNNPRVPYWLGVAAESRRPPEPDAAAAHYRKALTIDPVFLPGSLRLAALLQKQGKASEALALIKEAEKAGAPTEALELAWGQALIEAKNPTEAELIFRRAVARAPQLTAPRVGLATALEAAGKPDEAEAALGLAIRELKGAPGLRERLADLLYRRGKKEPALAQLQAELDAGNKSGPVRVRLAKLALELGHVDRAGRELESVVTDDPATPEALFTLGRVKEAAGDLGSALVSYKRALTFESSPDLHLTYGRALSAAGRDEEALGQLAGAGERALARLERARIYLRRGDIEKALAEVEAAVRVDPDDAQTQFVRGLCLDLQGRAADAANAWRAAVRSDPKLAEAHYRLGRFEMDQGKQKVALTHFRAASALEPAEVPWRADLYFQLGFAELATGSRGLAATALRKYLEVAPRDAPARPEAERELNRLAGR